MFRRVRVPRPLLPSQRSPRRCGALPARAWLYPSPVRPGRGAHVGAMSGGGGLGARRAVWFVVLMRRSLCASSSGTRCAASFRARCSPLPMRSPDAQCFWWGWAQALCRGRAYASSAAPSHAVPPPCLARSQRSDGDGDDDDDERVLGSEASARSAPPRALVVWRGDGCVPRPCPPLARHALVGVLARVLAMLANSANTGNPAKHVNTISCISSC